jgi:hypothetical protein
VVVAGFWHFENAQKSIQERLSGIYWYFDLVETGENTSILGREN